MIHRPVLLAEVIAGLAIRAGDTVLDATVNRGGHSRSLCFLAGAAGRLIGLDADAEAIAEAETVLAACPGRVDLAVRNFRELGAVLDEWKVKQVNAALFDLGLSSDQLERSGRGFSFERDEPLRMTFAAGLAPGRLTAAEIVNGWREESLADVIYGYGEERLARRIARAIVTARRGGPLETTAQLVAVIREAVPAWYRHGRKHFATRTFQALRIAVNDELGALQAGLEQLWPRLASGGRLAVITFHSLEARVVKSAFRSWLARGEGRQLAKKAIRPGRQEIISNPRSRSAQLRLIKKL